MKYFIFIVLVGIISSSCSSKLKIFHMSSMEDIDNAPYISHFEVSKDYKNTCKEALNYAPNLDYPLEYYQQTLRMNVHFVDADSSQYNFARQEGIKFYTGLLDNAIMRLEVNEKMNLPVGNDTPKLNGNYTYQLVDMDTEVGRSPYAFHKDDQYYWFLSKGKRRNNYSRDVIKKYAVDQDSVLNVFIQPTHPDSVASKHYTTTITGIALGNSIKMAGLYELGRPYWDYATLLNHEIAHTLGLGHAWYKNDGCDDTPANANCYSKTGISPCDGVISNNLMDYNHSQMAITPCQLGKIHRNFAKIKSKQRKLLIPVWCDYDDKQSIIINEDREWLGNKDLKNDIIIQDGATLTINCRVSMAANSIIIVRPGGKLILNQSQLHNSCGETWEGIEIQSKGKKTGEIIMYGDCKIDDVVTEGQ